MERDQATARTFVLRDAGRKLARHWPALVALAAVGLFTRELLLDAAVRAGRLTSVTGLLVLALVPLASMLVTVAMLLVMRPSRVPFERRARAVLAAVASLIVPYLVVYEHYGNLEEDQRVYYYESVWDAIDHANVGSRVPQGASLVVIATVVGALLVRWLANRVATQRAWPSAHDPRRAALQVVAGYAEVVWIILGVFVVTLVVGRLTGWVEGRVVVAEFGDWWDDLTSRFDLVADLWGFAVPAAGYVISGVLVGIVVPISWLAFGTVVYGIQAADVVVASSASSATRTGRILGRVANRVGPSTLDRAWRFSVDSERRFGPLVGGLALIRRAGGGSALLFCLAYVIVGQAGYLVWGIARLVVGAGPIPSWTALATPLDGVATILVQVLSAALLASAADALVGRLGATPQPPADQVKQGGPESV